MLKKREKRLKQKGDGPKARYSLSDVYWMFLDSFFANKSDTKISSFFHMKNGNAKGTENSLEELQNVTFYFH